MKRYSYASLSKCVKKFKWKKILVLGDILLDQYIFGEVSRISPEAPVPVVWMKKEEFMPGGSSNVAVNLVSLGAEISLAGVIGNDIRGTLLVKKLSEIGIDTQCVLVDPVRPTSLKTRVIAHHQQVVRIDREDIDDLTSQMRRNLIDKVVKMIPSIDGIIIEDYGKGVITPELIKPIIAVARKKKKFISVDPKEEHFSIYKGVSVITPNLKEAGNAMGYKIKTNDEIVKAGNKLLKTLNAENILITLGEDGMMIFEKNKKPKKISTIAQEVFDVSGAGDTVIAVFTLAKASGASSLTAANIANCAAGIVVAKVGAASCTVDELLKRLKKEIKGN